ncbi:MAG: hypothetical protein IRZ07_27340 [Microbispora sp.]|nr:hypothetical protein [Microbispora sp.]
MADKTLDDETLPVTAQQLAATLSADREILHTRRDHRVKARLDMVGYRDALARIREEAARRRDERRLARAERRENAAAAKAARRESRRDRAEQRRLAELYRAAAVSGERARLAVAIRGSVEARQHRVDQVRTATLKVGLPVLAAFAAWSTVGVHAGVVGLLGAAPGSAWWWGAWFIEPALIAVVAGVIVARAVLRASGGDVDWRAHVAHWGALAVSIMLNLAGHWPTAFTGPEVTAAIAHSVGPLGAATVAWLIGVMDDYVTAARPEEGARTLAELGVQRERVAAHAPAAAAEVPGPASPSAPAVEPPEPAAETEETAGASNVTPLKPRPRVSDEELLERARAVYEPGMSVNEFRRRLGVGMKKAHPLHQLLRQGKAV